jgi:hypothetical protein
MQQTLLRYRKPLILLGLLLLLVGGAAGSYCQFFVTPLPAPQERRTSLIGEQFPRLAGEALDGTQVVFPDSVKGQPALILVAFQQRTQPQVDTWLQQAQQLQQRYPALQVYEVPMIAQGYSVMSDYIDSGMRSGIPQDQHSQVVTYYGARERYFEAFGVDDKRSCYAFLLDPDGTVRMQAEGAYEPQNDATMLKEALKKAAQ